MLQVCGKTYIGLYEMFINDVRFKPKLECSDIPPSHTHNDRTESLAHLCIRIMHYAVNLLFIYRYYNEVLIKDVNIFCPALYSAVSLLCWG